MMPKKLENKKEQSKTNKKRGKGKTKVVERSGKMVSLINFYVLRFHFPVEVTIE